MGEEKIFKDLTKKYAELAKKIHSKDKKSSSLIKSCSKRIALLDKLRVLEVSYLKCLKNKIKRGQKGGEGERKQQEDDANQQEATDIIGMELNKAKNTNDEGQDDGTPQNNNHQRALAVCTTALEKSMDLKDVAKNFIEEKIEKITNIYNNIDTEETKARLLEAKYKLIQLNEDLISNKGMTSEDVKNLFEGAKQILAEKVDGFYKDNKDTTLEEVVNNISQKSDKVVKKISPVINQGLGVAKQGLEVAGRFGSTVLQDLRTRLASATQPTTGGSKKTTYRLNGEKVVLLYKNKKVQRSIYVKGNGKTKYCKINKEYVLLSKVKNKIQ